MIDNPDYIGEWTPKQIDNPAFFETDNVFAELDSIAGVAIDIWTMQKGIEYDNVYVGTSEDAAYRLASTWEIRRDYQQAAMGSADSGSSSDMVENAMSFVQENMVAVAVTVVLIFLSIFYFMCTGGNEVPAPEQAEEEVDNAENAEKKQGRTCKEGGSCKQRGSCKG